MQVIETPFGKIDISFELLQEYRKSFQGTFGIDDNFLVSLQVQKLLLAFMSTSREYIDERIDKRPHNVRMLSAHGETLEKDYYYREIIGRGLYAFYSVQSWVEDYDGKYDALVVQVCNPGGVPLSSKSSILVYPRDPFDNMEILYSAVGGGLGMFVVREPKYHE